jgi:DNA-binding protein HU-beta
MNKTELIERIAEEADVPTREAQKHFEAFEHVVTEALKSGEEIRITGFGKFSVREQGQGGQEPPDRGEDADRGPEGSRLYRGQHPQGGHLSPTR